MKLEEAAELLNISRTTLYRYRKKLGIVSETKDDVDVTHFEQLKKEARQTVKYAKKIDLDKIIDEAVVKDLYLLEKSDPFEVSQLKTQFNNNKKLIDSLQKEIDLMIASGEIPDKFILDSMEKFQKLNMKIMSDIEKIKPQADNLSSMIKEKLANYG